MLGGTIARGIAIVAAAGLLIVASPSPAAWSTHNDDFGDAMTIRGIPFRHEHSTGGATVQAGERPQCGGGLSGTVWYRFTPRSAAHVKIDTSGSDLDSVLDLYTGTRIRDLKLRACSTGNLTRKARIIFDTRAGETYHVRLSGRYGDAGSYVLVVDRTLLPCTDVLIGTDLCYLSPAA